MDATAALLRIVAQAAAASAALVVRPGRAGPVVAWGCDGAAAEALLRVRAAELPGADSLFRSLALTFADGAPGELLLVGAAAPPAGAAALPPGGTLEALAREIGAACPGAGGAEPARPPGPLERLIESVDQLGEAVAILRTPPGEDGHFVHVNGPFARLFGFAAGELTGQPRTRVWGPLTDGDRMDWVRSRMARNKAVRAVVVLYTREGTPLWTELSAAPIAAGAGRPAHHVITYRDVTARQQFEDALSAEKRKLQTTLASIADAVVTVLGDGRVEFVNAAAQRLLGIALIDAYGARVSEVIRLVDDDGVPLDVAAGAGSGEAAQRGEGQLRTATGTIDVAYVASRIDDEDQGAVIVLRDVTAENRLSLRLSFEANHDPLTGLPNRRALLERLQGAVHGAREQGAHHALAYLDLDRFKTVNDRFGHAAGDRLLREIGRVMSRVVRGGDVLARIGGDEFALLLADCTLENARWVIDKLRCAVEEYRIEHEGEALGIGVSIGLAAVERKTASAAGVLAEADAACYRAKHGRRTTVAG